VVLLHSRLRGRFLGDGTDQDLRIVHHPQAALADPSGGGGARPGRADRGAGRGDQVGASGAGTHAGGGGTVRTNRVRTRDEHVTESRSSRMSPTWARRALVGVLSAALLFAVPSGVAVAAQPSP